MISLINYEEFGPDMGFRCMKDFFEPTPYEGQDKIVFYLDNGTTTYVSAMQGKDFYTGETIQGLHTGKTDGEYSWSSVLSYYVQRYNLRLPKEFEEKVFKKIH